MEKPRGEIKEQVGNWKREVPWTPKKKTRWWLAWKLLYAPRTPRSASPTKKVGGAVESTRRFDAGSRTETLVSANTTVGHNQEDGHEGFFLKKK